MYSRQTRLLAAIMALVCCGAVVGSVQAQRPDGPGPRPSPPGPPAGPVRCDPGSVGGLLGDFAARLGHNLGATEEQVRAVLPQTLEAMRPQIESSVRQLCPSPPNQPVPGGPGLPGGPARGPGTPNPEAIISAAAQLLGMDPPSLRQELERVGSLAAIAEARGIDPETLADELTQLVEEMRVQQMRQGIRRLLDQRLPPAPNPQMP